MKNFDIDVPLHHPHLLLPFLKELNFYEYELIKIKGALTNVIYKLITKDKDGSILNNYLIRIFGSKLDSLVDRENELISIKRVPHEVGMVNILYTFNNGRIEYFLNGFRSVKQHEMVNYDFQRQIAHKFNILHNSTLLSKAELEASRNLGFSWLKIFEWMEQIENLDNGYWINYNKSENVHNILLAKDWMVFKQIVFKYYHWLLENDSKSFEKMTFCHNDLQQGNILVEEKTCNSKAPNILFIDYEYCGINTVSFDLSNFLTECMHDYDCSFSESYKCIASRYPNKEQILFFLRSYLSYDSENVEIEQEDMVNDETLKDLYNSIIRWRASTQLFWAIWAILQSGQVSQKKNIMSFSNNKLDSSREESSSQMRNYESYYGNETDDDDSTTLSSANGVDEDSETIHDEESFDYISFCKSKISFFWSDLIDFRIAKKEDCACLNELNFLRTDML